MSHRRTIAVALLLAAACTRLRLTPPEELAGAPAWTLEQPSLRLHPRRGLGPYEIAMLDLGSTLESGRVDSTGKDIEWRRYRFEVLADSGRHRVWRGSCRSTDARRGGSIGRLGDFTFSAELTLDCELEPLASDDPEPWRLHLRASNDDPASGTLERNGRIYALSGERDRRVHDAASRYLVRRSGALLGAVDRLDAPVVRMSDVVRPSEPVLPALVALALHDPVEHPASH